MNRSELDKVAKGKRNLTDEIASRSSDPNFYGGLDLLPNPDTVLRKLGKSHEVFDALLGDAHVMGELRSVRAGLLGFEWQIQAGGDSPADLRAKELCDEFLAAPPAPGMRWADVIWNMAQAIFFGYRVHEVVWSKKVNGVQLPVKILDRPNRRFVFGINNELRLKTKAQPMHGEELPPKRFLLSRHMPSAENPYGVSVFSACFWPYTFKHGGFRYFVKFCEKYGLPKAVGKYPPGTEKKERDEFLNQLAAMIEDNAAVIPDNGSVELLESKHSGEPVHAHLINYCNREISKALTSQTLATEIQGEGSRAASETHSDRQAGVAESDREIICATFNELLAWITEINVANAKPPKFSFYQEEEAQLEMVKYVKEVNSIMDVSETWARERLNAPVPEDEQDTLQRSSTPQNIPPGGNEFSGHNCPHCAHEFAANGGRDELDDATDMAADQADEVIAEFIAQASETLAQFEAEGKSLMEFKQTLNVMMRDLPEETLAEVNKDAFLAALLSGASDEK